MIELDFIPYQLYHTEMYTSPEDESNKEVMKNLKYVNYSDIMRARAHTHTHTKQDLLCHTSFVASASSTQIFFEYKQVLILAVTELAQLCSQIEKLSFYVSHYNLNIVLIMPCV
jgi:hypothetical protein